MPKRRIDYDKLHGTFEERKGEIAKFNLMDDTFFSVVMEDNTEACQILLRILLNKPDLIVTSVRTQDNLRNLYGHSVTMDAKAVDSKGKHYIIEIQVRDDDDFQRRSRMYVSMTDYKLTDKGTKYKDIPDVYVIFITGFDMFKMGQNCYEIKRVVRSYETNENLTKQADNGVHEFYFCVKPELNQSNTELAKLLNYMANSSPENSDFGALSSSVKSNKIDEKGVDHMCELMEDLCSEREAKGKAEGEKEGKIEGKIEGKKEGKMEALKALVDAGMDEKLIRKALGL